MDAVLVVLRVVLALAVVLGLLWIAQRRIAKGPRSVRSTRLVSVVSRQGIAQKASVVVVDVEGKRFLLGVTEHSVTVLDSAELEATASESAVVDAPARSARDAVAGPHRSSTTSASAFGSILASAKKSAPAPGLTAFDPRTGQPRTGILDGSIISPATWKRAAMALRSRW